MVTDFETTELYVAPFAMAVLCYVVGSIPLMILPLMSMPTVIIVSFALMHWVSHHISVASIAPPLMASLNVALAIDYAMFLLRRFQEAYHTYGDLDLAIELM